ncbi:MAG: SLOG family protein [Parabacteroides sp.]|nr:SLOG family protein [Parabacteroides sp.]
MELQSRTVCFTGHRKIPPEKLETVARRLKETLIELIGKGYLYFGAGGALGFDTLAAQTVLELKAKFPQIKLILVLPCLSQADSWGIVDKRIYEQIKEKADKIVYTSREYTKGCMHKRNRHLVDNSSVCVCYLSENTGGTAYTVSYAESKSLLIINIV